MAREGVNVGGYEGGGTRIHFRGVVLQESKGRGGQAHVCHVCGGGGGEDNGEQAKTQQGC